MKYYPVFLKLAGERVIFSGAGEHAAAKIKLLLKTEANVCVFGEDPCDDVLRWAHEGLIVLVERPLEEADSVGARLVYGANDEPDLDAHAVELGKAVGALTNIVDNLEASAFLTPAIVDRDPVIVAIGTEGTAPVLARKIKKSVEEMLPVSTGVLARLASQFRPKAAQLGASVARRAFWSRFFFTTGPAAFAANGESGVQKALDELLIEAQSPKQLSIRTAGHVDFVGAGPGDPELLTMKARRLLHDADVVLHDRLVTPEILELVRREAIVRSVGKEGFGPSWKQEDINNLLVEHVHAGHRVVRLKSGDAAIFGRLDEEIETLDAAGLSWHVVPGITSASAAAATIGMSLTRRNRNASLQFLTAHDMNGFADQNWRELAKPHATAAIYMGVKAAHYFAGRLLMHGALDMTPITVVENVSRPDERIIATNLTDLSRDLAQAHLIGPAIILLGLQPRIIRNLELSDLGDTKIAVGRN